MKCYSEVSLVYSQATLVGHLHVSSTDAAIDITVAYIGISIHPQIRLEKQIRQLKQMSPKEALFH